MEPNTNHDEVLNKEPSLFSRQMISLKNHTCCHGSSARKGRRVMRITATEKYTFKKRVGSHSGILKLFNIKVSLLLIIEIKICVHWHANRRVLTWGHATTSQRLCVYCGLMQDCPWWSLESGLFVSLTESIRPPFLYELLDAKADPNTNWTIPLMRSLIPTRQILSQHTEQVMYL